MRYLALATDYDGTLAHHGKVSERALAALDRLKRSGRRLVLVTGRELPDLANTFEHTDLFDLIVAENGALLYKPATKEEKPLAPAPPRAFIDAVLARRVAPVSVGRVIVATWEPHQQAVLDAIRETGLELQVIFNKGAVMVLPSGVNKATGLAAALDELGLSPHNVVAVGDAENDHAFLAACECGVAVSNALPAVKEKADLVTRGDHGDGVIELIDALVADDLAGLAPRLTRHHVLLGKADDGSEVRLEPYGQNVLVAGTSGSGKSTLTTGLMERLGAAGYQYVMVDPEGDYQGLEGAVVVGNPDQPPRLEEVADLLKSPRQNVVVNLLGIGLSGRPDYFNELLPRLQALRATTGRPHWVFVDEAHHLLPTAWAPADLALPRQLHGMLYITVHPESVARAVSETIDLVLAVGERPGQTLAAFCRAAGREPPPCAEAALAPGEVLAWRPRQPGAPCRVVTEPPRTERRRHSRKYAEGNVGQDRSFFFRGPDGRLNLRAQNLVVFLQLAEGVDDDTWLYHLRRGDYSTWFRDGIKDADLAADVARVEERHELPPADSRAAVRAAVEKRYTLPADRPSGQVDAAG